MIKKILIKFAYLLHSSNRYKKIKTVASNLLTNSDYEYKKYFDIFMISLIVVSIAILVYEVKNSVPEWIEFFDIYIVTTIFLLEYIARVWVYNDWHKQVVKEVGEAQFLNCEVSLWTPTKVTLKGKIQYLLTPTAIIDLLAILPAYRPLRVLRIFVLFRVFKLLRYTKSINQFLGVLASKKFELFTLLFLLVFITVTAGIAIYVFEQNENENISSIFDALYWALITISTVGYGDISPVTPEGRVVSMIIIITGIAMISFVTSVIVSSFSEKLDELKENRIVEELNKKDEFMIICGYGQMTRMFLRYYAKEYDKRYIVIENDKDKVEEAIKEGYKAIHEDASKHDVIKRFNLQYSNITLLALTGSDIANIYITLNAKSLSRKIKVIARARTDKMIKKYQLAGADSIVRPNVIADRMLYTAITQPVMYKAIYAILTGKNMALLDEVKLSESELLVGRTIKSLELKRQKLLCIGLQRAGDDGEFLFNPSSETTLETSDTLLVMGRRVSIEYFKNTYKKVKYV